MIFTPTDLPGVTVVDLDPRVDERGMFARAFCAQEFADHGLCADVVQTNLSINHRAGTLRGLHYQVPPAAETKLVRCVRGAFYDVVVDLRTESPTYLEHVGVELSAANRRALHVPEGCAHGFLTLVDDTEAIYQVSEFYAPGTEGGVRYDDPALHIAWPREVAVISDKDLTWPRLVPAS